LISSSANRCYVSKLVSPQILGSSRFSYSGSWTVLNADHGDTREPRFQSERRGRHFSPPMAAFMRRRMAGRTGTFVGGGRSGYNALQITEVKGQWDRRHRPL